MKRRSHSIRNKFIVMVFAICLSCLLVVSVISYGLSYNLVKAQTNQSASEAVGKNAAQLNNWFMEQAQVVNSIAQDIEINKDFSDQYLTNYLIEKFERQNSKVLDYYIGFADKKRTMVCATGWIPPPDYDATTREWYIEALKHNKLVFITPYLDADSHQMVITLAEPIKDGNNVVGVIAADILLTDVMDLAHDARIKGASYTFLMDNDYNYMIHPQPGFQPTPEKSINAALVMQGRFLPLIEEIKKGQYNIVELRDYDNTKRCFVLSNIKAANWTFGIAIPRSEYIKPLNNLLFGFGAALAISLLMGILIILPVIRSLLKPVLQLNEAVSSFAEKDFTARSLVSSRDEVGELSENFNRMADIIEEYNQNLERTVAQRTSSIRNLLNNAGQGFLSFGHEFYIDEEYSSECNRIFGREIAGQRFTDLIFPDDEEQKRFMENALLSIMQDDDELRREVYFSLLPQELLLNGCNVSLDYKLIVNRQNEEIDRIMIILTDITEQRQLELHMEGERKLLKMVVKVVAYNNDFQEYCSDYRNFCSKTIWELLDSSRPREEIIAEIYRRIHTFKGGFAQLEMINMAEKLHQCESQISASQDEFSKMSGQQLKTFFASLNMLEWMDEDLAMLREILGEQFLEQDNLLVIDEAQLLEINQKVVSTLSPWECKLLLPDLNRLMFKPMRELFKPYPETVARLAERLNKSILPVNIAGGEVPVDTEQYRDFCKTLIHVFRNAVDHGLESAEERIANGKEEYGTISCEILQDESGILIVISDDGRGIDVEHLKERAVQKGICDRETAAGLSAQEALQLVFVENLTVNDEITSISGRGIGLAAVKEELDKLGGSVELFSQAGMGTVFTFHLPCLESNKLHDISVNDMINPLLHTMQEFFSREIGENLLHSSETEKQNRLQLYKTTAISNIKGIIRSSLILSVDEELGKQLVHKMILDEIETGTEGHYVEDVLAECVNIILGNSIKHFPEIQELIMFEAPVTLFSERTAIKYMNADIWTCDMLFTTGKASLSLIVQEKLQW
ncbi:MAG: cache domain-containing protein [Syntrophomonadaceae bacterium]|nr:cache domain-containing protein [Syntrophomonadaceae bacterium]